MPSLSMLFSLTGLGNGEVEISAPYSNYSRGFKTLIAIVARAKWRCTY